MVSTSISTHRNYKIIDLFAGCGGISRGFEWTRRFSTEFAIELEKHPANTLSTNLVNSKGASPHVYQGDIRDLTKGSDRLWEQLNAAGITTATEIDVIVGGPPCQGFSRNGVRQYKDDSNRERFYDDPRNHLYKSFLFVLEELKPKLVLIENVREFLNFGKGKFSSDLVSKLDEIGYYVEYKKLNAAEFGVPQKRHRAFFIGTRKDVADLNGQTANFPEPTCFAGNGNLQLFGKYQTVRDAISDLPDPVYAHELPALKYPQLTNISKLASFLRSETGLVHNHVARVLSAKSLERVKAVGTGRMKNIDPKLRTKKFYGSAYRRMSWDEPSLTITTWVYHVGSGRFAHPKADRAITMREAARIQTFDDDFIFPPLINPVSQMIGNAVPPLLANQFAKQFLRFLDAIEIKLENEQNLRNPTAA